MKYVFIMYLFHVVDVNIYPSVSSSCTGPIKFVLAPYTPHQSSLPQLVYNRYSWTQVNADVHQFISSLPL